MNIRILNSELGQSPASLICEAAQSFKRKMQRIHELWILSCYIDLDLVREFADLLCNKIRLKKIYLAFDSSEIYRIGFGVAQNKLNDIRHHLYEEGIVFEWRALASPGLMNGKGYALFQTTGPDGVVFMTSADFTNSDFRHRQMNIESGYFSSEGEDIEDFTRLYDELWNRSEEGSGAGPNQYNVQFSLLSSGIFLHKWDGNFTQLVGIRYRATSDGVTQAQISQELTENGFEMRAGDTLTRRVLQDLPTKMVPRSFIRNFTIETYWGRWCPSDAWDTLKNALPDGGVELFIQKFQEMTTDNILDEKVEEALVIQKNMIRRGLLRQVGPEHLERWKNRIQKLRENRRRLERLYNGYDAHKLPYRVDQESDIHELFDSIKETIELSKATNVAKTKFQNAQIKDDPKLILLTEKERGDIIKNVQIK